MMLSQFVRIRHGIGVGLFLRVRAHHVVGIVMKQISRLIMCFICYGTGAVLVSAAILVIELIELLYRHEVFADGQAFFFLHGRARAPAVEGRQIDFFILVFLFFDVEELANAIAGHTVLTPLFIVLRGLLRHLLLIALSDMHRHGLLHSLDTVLHFQRDLGRKFINYIWSEKVSFYTDPKYL